MSIDERPQSQGSIDERPRSQGSSDGRPRSQGSSDFNERRKKADWVVKMATIMSVVSWAVALAVWVVLDRAQPEKEDMFTRYFNIAIRENWNASLLPVAFTLLVASLCICIIAFVFNMLRMRRKTDKYRKSIIVIGVITIIGIVLFIIQFGLSW